MQQFTVPQFIDVEDKILGPITTRQFLLIIVGFLICAVSYKLFDFSLFLVIAGITVGAVSAFAFVKVNGRPFHFFVVNLVETMIRPKIRIWNHKDALKEAEENILEASDRGLVKEALLPFGHKYSSKSRLTELALIVDTQGRYKGGSAGEKTNVSKIPNS